MHSEDRFFKIALIAVPLFVLSLTIIAIRGSKSSGISESKPSNPVIASQPLSSESSPDSPKVSERQICAEKIMVSHDVTLEIAQRYCECRLRVLAQTGSNDDATKAAESCAKADVSSSQSRRLTELRKKQENLEWAIAVQVAQIKERLRDPSLPELSPAEQERINRLIEEKKAVDAEITEAERAEAKSDEPRPAEKRAVRDSRDNNELLKERQNDLDMIAAIEGILNASSMTERVEIYCRFTVDKAQEILAPGASSVNKQVQDFNHEQNINRCKGVILIGYQRMPDLDELREKARQAREHIAEIDRELAARRQ